MRSGMMAQLYCASAVGSSAKGCFSLMRITLSDGALISSVRAISACPIGSRTTQRLIVATQSFASTGVLSWKRSPSRSVMSHCLPSPETWWPSTICGCTPKLASYAYSVSYTISEKLRVTSAVVHTGSNDARSDCGMKLITLCPAARTTRGAVSTVAPASADFSISRRFIFAAPCFAAQGYGNSPPDEIAAPRTRSISAPALAGSRLPRHATC